MERKWHDRLGLFLIVALFLIEIPRYQSTLPDHNAVVALGMGTLLAGGAYYCVETWGMLKRRSHTPARTGWLAKMILVQIALAPVIMTPALVAQERGKQVADLLAEPLLVAWIAVVTLAPVAVGGMVAFARSLQYDQSELRSSSKAGSSAQDATLKQAHDVLAKRISVLEAELSQQMAGTVQSGAGFECSYCGEAFASKQARSAHEAWCEQNPNSRRVQPNDNGSPERNVAK
jgi:hypothetical protein